MAITFEDKSSGNRTIIIVLLAVAVLAAAGYFGWNVLVASLPPVEAPQPVMEKIDYKVLTDARLDSLELFPEIPPSSVPAGKNNPFIEGDSIATTTAENESD